MPAPTPSAPSHQTIKLSKGKHVSPEDGACVMELASMLAGEPFSDRPPSVCPVIGAVMREYNDTVDDTRRQDLYEYAAKVVGTHANDAVERERIERCQTWLHSRRHRRSRISSALVRMLLIDGETTPERVANRVVRSVGRPDAEAHASILSLIDELCSIGEGTKPSTPVETQPLNAVSASA